MYVGEMERSLGERAQERDKSIKEGDSESALSEHQVITGHKIFSKLVIEGVNVIDSEPRNMHRKVKEAIYMKLQGATLNRTGGYDLPTFAERGDQGGRKRLTAHATTAVITSGMAVLPVEAKLLSLVGEINIGGNLLP